MTIKIQGKAYWCKIVGDPVPNKFKNGQRQWSFDLSVDEETQQKLIEAGMKKSYLKNKSDDRDTFITFTRDENKVDGTPGKPFEVVDNQKQPWPENKLIGNGSVLNVLVLLSERQFRGETFLKPVALKIQVWDHNEFAKTDFPVKDHEAEQQAEGASW